MKKISLFFFMSLLSLCSYAQIGIDPPEGFEGDTFPPTGWSIYDNDIGTFQSWKQTINDPDYPYPPNTGDYAAIIDRENVPDDGDPAKDWLVTPSFEMPINGQLHFWSRLTLNGNQGTVYRIMMAPEDADLSDLASYTVVSTYTEAFINPIQQDYNEVVLNLPGTVGENYHIAFLMEGDFQDRWLIDDVSIVEQCLPPTNLNVSAITATSATLTWTGGATQYEVEVVPIDMAPIGSGVIVDGNSYVVSPLMPTTVYRYYIRSVCSDGNTSDWTEPFEFNTVPGNDACADAILLTVNPTNICTTSTQGSINGATASGEDNSCIGTANDDVWFKFVATSTTHLIDLVNVSNGTSDLVHVVYEGDSCDSLVQLFCNNPNSSIATNLTIGNIYYVRVYSYTSTAGQTTNFNICIGTPPPPPANDECATATIVPVNPDLNCAQFVTGTIYSATASAEANTCTGTADDDIWFSFTATNISHTINLNNITGSTTFLRHILYSGTCGALTQVYCSTTNNSIANDLVPGATYYIRVYSTSSTPQTSVFDVCIGTPPPPPANDECADATMLTVNSDVNCANYTSGTIAWATASAQDPVPCSGTEDDDVWYQFVATSNTHSISFTNIAGSTTTLYHTVYSGECNALTLLNCSTTTVSSIGGLTIGDTYTVRVYTSTSTGGQTTTYDICIGTPPPPPANDNCETAIDIPVNADLACEAVVSGTVAWATPSPQSGSGCAGTEDDDVWFQFTATHHTHVVNLSNVEGSSTLIYQTAYLGTCDDLTQINCTSSYNTTLTGLIPGQTYFIRIYTSTNTPGQDTTFDICVGTPPPPPANDECANAEVVLTNQNMICNDFVSGTIAWATASAEPNTCAGSDDDDVWYQFEATGESHIINFNNVTGSTTFLYHVVYEGTSCDSMTQLYCSTSNISLASDLTAGQTYYVRVYTNISTAGQTTSFDLCITTPPPPPANDECANAITVTVNPTEVCENTALGTVNGATPSAEGNTCFGTDDDDVWFEFTATNDVHFIKLFNISQGTTDLYHVVYEGDECGALTQLYCSNDNLSFASGLTVGNTYKIRVYSYTSTPGQTSVFDVCVATPPSPPVNDECENAITIPVNPDQLCASTVPGSVFSATASPQANTCYGSDDDDVWFEFIATNEMHIISFLNVDGNSLYYTVYEGDECGALTQIFCGTNNQSFVPDLTIGNTYKVRVYTYTNLINQVTSFDICVSTPPPPPVNDECAEAIVVPVNVGAECIESASGTIFSATESPEDNTCGGTDDDDVWFEFTASETSHFINLNNITGGTTSLYHSVYEGEDCGILAQLYCSTSLQSLAENLTVGATYKIRVYSSTGTPNQTSSFDICIGVPVGSITVNETLFTPEQLVETVLIGSECAVVSNISSRTGTDFGLTGGIGYFNANNSNFPFDDGIVLATGSVNEAPGPYPNNNSGTQNSNWIGDNDLAAIIAEGGNTGPLSNASVLEFDFVPLTNQITFDFMFASNEYGIYQCTYGDAFAFILTDEDGNSQNLAVIPGTNVPVSVVNIRNEIYNDNCPSVNPQYFGSFNQTNPYGSAIAYRGQTVVMTAAGDVIPGNQYHIKLVIADYNDFAFSSAVFLAGGSFDIGGLDLGLDLTVIDGTAICDNEVSVIETGLNEEDYSFVWYTVDGEGVATVIENETGASLTVSETNDYRVIATYTGSTCSLEGNKRVEFYVPVTETVGAPVDLIACDASGFATFDFTSNTDLIEAGVIAGYDVADFAISYHASEDDAQDDVNPIGPVYDNTVAELQTIYVRVVYTPTGCVGILNFNLIIQDLTPDFDMGGDFNICEGTTGATIDLVANNYNPASPDVTYSWTYNGDALPDTGSSIAVTGEGTYEVTVNNSGCEATQSVFVTVTPIPVADVMENVVACDTYILPALSPNNFYHTPEGETLAAGTEITTDQMIYIYTESGTSPANCTDESSFTVSLVPTPLIGITGGCIGGRYTLEVSLDDEYYTEETVIIEWTDPNGAIISTDLTAVAEEIGEYMVTVTPAGGDICSSVLVHNVESAACTIPRGISPNGDNMNDNFDLSGLGVIKLSIFNRYGKEVYSKTDYSDEWYGLDKHGKELPTGTYFYSLELNDGTSKTGWVYINREN